MGINHSMSNVCVFNGHVFFVSFMMNYLLNNNRINIKIGVAQSSLSGHSRLRHTIIENDSVNPFSN